MSTNSRAHCAALVWIAALAVGVGAAPRSADAATRAKERPTTRVSHWLLLGPAVDPLPAFHEDKPFAYGVDDLLKTDRFSRSADPPTSGRSVSWPGATKTASTKPTASHLPIP